MNIWITDKTGKKFFNTSVAAAWASGERNNLSRHLGYIRARNPDYTFVDAETARIVEELDKGDVPAKETFLDSITTEMSVDDILEGLGV